MQGRYRHVPEDRGDPKLTVLKSGAPASSSSSHPLAPCFSCGMLLLATLLCELVE
jgi:hypothetical protein